MSEIRTTQLNPPRYEEMCMLREVVSEIAHEPASQLKQSNDESRMLVHAYGSTTAHDTYVTTNGQNVLVMTTDIICLTGISRTMGRTEQLKIRFRQFPLVGESSNHSLVHDYTLCSDAGQMTEFSQRIIARPLLSELSIGHVSSYSDEQLSQIEQGGKILKHYLGEELELTAGDCGVLYDRLHESFLQ